MSTRALLHKVRWGVQVVGPVAAVVGAFRYLGVRLRRPSVTVLPIRSGGELEVAVPGQMIPALAVFGDLIDPEYDVLRRCLRPGAVVVDVGAGVGQFTVFAALAGAGVVHAVEPDDANLATLGRNTVRNGVADRVTTHRLALADRVGAAALVAPIGVAAARFNGRITPAEVGADPGDDAGRVPVDRLDGWSELAGVERIDVLKVNVAGDERAVLEGGRGLFDARRIDLVVVLIGTGVVESLQQLTGLGYRWFLPRPGGRELVEYRWFDDRFLLRRPFPTRHVLGASEPAVAGGLLDGFRMVAGG